MIPSARSRQIFLAVAVIGLASTAQVRGDDCDGRFFAESDNNNEKPLTRPTKAFTALSKAAKSGDASAQRSLAVAYETGYLVSRCGDQAIYWYDKAAAAGDDIARKWTSQHKTIAALQSGPECAGDHCFGPGSNENRIAVLYANPNRRDHYFAPLTINGHTVEGMIDTGASTIAMSAETARQLGIDISGGNLGRSSTASGTIATTSVVVPLVDVAGIRLRNVPVSVGITGMPLIGMSFLGRVNITMASGQLTMTKRQ